jgi:biopolymer transport protein ExbB
VISIEDSVGRLLAAAAPAGPTDPMAVQSIWDFIVMGGWAMIPIGACSFVALAIIIERALVVRRRRVIPPAFVAGLKKTMAQSGRNREAALDYCRKNGSPIARVLEEAVRNSNESTDVLDKRVEEAGARHVVPLRRNMRLLSSLPQVSTMLGLLGTVFGMIKTFQAVAATSEALGKTEMLAEGIFEAWTCTAAGLLVAIPVLVAYHMLMGRIDMIVAEVDRVASEWLESEKNRAPAAADVRSVNQPELDGSSRSTVLPVW